MNSDQEMSIQMSGGRKEKKPLRDDHLELESLDEDDYKQQANGKVFTKLNQKNGKGGTPNTVNRGQDRTNNEYDTQSSNKNLISGKQGQDNRVTPIPFYSQGQNQQNGEEGFEKPMSSARALFGFKDSKETSADSKQGNKVAPELIIDENKIQGMALVKYTNSPAYRLRMCLSESCYGRALKIAVAIVIVIVVAVIIYFVVESQGEEIDWD